MVRANHVRDGWKISVANASQFIGEGAPEQLMRLYEKARPIHEEVQHAHETQRPYNLEPVLDGITILGLFAQQSTRTSISSDAAAQLLGAQRVWSTDPSVLAIGKGESLESTLSTVAQYCHAIVMRGEKDSKNIALDVLNRDGSNRVYINAGNGKDQHPTQGLLDWVSIQYFCGGVEGKRIAYVGDLANGRTVHSSLPIVAQFQPEAIHLVSPEALSLPENYLKTIQDMGVTVTTHDTIDDVAHADIIYCTRAQTNLDKELLDRLPKDFYKDMTVTEEFLDRTKGNATVLHPLPAGSELSDDIKQHEQVRAYEQAGIGMATRAAMYALIFSNN